MIDAANNTIAIEAMEPADRLLADEDPITLTEAVRRLPKIGGRKICSGTVWQWCRNGLRGVELGYVRVARKICTVQQAVVLKVLSQST